MSGRVVQKFNFIDSVLKRKIDLSFLPGEIYFLKMETGEGVVMKRVVVQRY
jgi:hypothetical protein